MASWALPQTPLGGSEHPQTPSSFYHAYGVIDRNDRNSSDFWKYLICILVFIIFILSEEKFLKNESSSIH